MEANHKDVEDPPGLKRMNWMALLGLTVAWGWTIVACGGGAMLLFERGPGRLTNGWFALASGLAACPTTAWLGRRFLGISPSGRARFAATFLIWLAGQVARRAGL
jgi:hypothetical protein